jgi:hypothetical protein
VVKLAQYLLPYSNGQWSRRYSICLHIKSGQLGVVSASTPRVTSGQDGTVSAFTNKVISGQGGIVFASSLKATSGQDGIVSASTQNVTSGHVGTVCASTVKVTMPTDTPTEPGREPHTIKIKIPCPPPFH